MSLERALSVFVDTADPVEGDDAGDCDRYAFKIANELQFHLIIDFLKVGSSFRAAARILQMTKDRTGLASMGSCSDVKAATYARFACALNLQKLSEILGLVWAFSVAMDMSTHMGTSYLDIRVRFHLFGTIRNFHLLAIPLFERHTGLAMFEAAAKCLDVLCSEWRDLIIGISTDGERKMTGRIQGELFVVYLIPQSNVAYHTCRRGDSVPASRETWIRTHLVWSSSIRPCATEGVFLNPERGFLRHSYLIDCLLEETGKSCHCHGFPGQESCRHALGINGKSKHMAEGESRCNQAVPCAKTAGLQSQ